VETPLIKKAMENPEQAAGMSMEIEHTPVKRMAQAEEVSGILAFGFDGTDIGNRSVTQLLSWLRPWQVSSRGRLWSLTGVSRSSKGFYNHIVDSIVFTG
jgi:hypothetical protein